MPQINWHKAFGLGKKLFSGSTRREFTPGQLVSGLQKIFGTIPGSGRAAQGSGSDNRTKRGGQVAQHAKPSRQSAVNQPAPGGYVGDFESMPKLEYRPYRDGRPQPGEVAWAWVPFEEDYSRGKDRPVLLIGEQGGYLLALPLTSKDHQLDAAQERRAGRYWQDIGTGEWDAQGRDSDVRLDRAVRLRPTDVRRVAGTLDPELFRIVAEGVKKHWRD